MCRFQLNIVLDSHYSTDAKPDNIVVETSFLTVCLRMFAYAYPPKCLIPRVIQYIEAIPLSDFTDCAPMAQETLVSGTTTAIDGISNPVTNISGIT
jgi:hypothetical protein